MNILSRTLSNVPFYIYGDKTKLTQVVSNLLLNALKFSTIKSAVYVTVSTKEDFLHIRIKDTGPGMSPEKMDTLFKEFVTESNDLVAGTGLGLHISQKIADRMGGSIGVGSQMGKGSAFTIKIPCIPIEEQEVPAKDSGINENNPPETLNKNVFIIEDNEMHVVFLKKFLKKWGCTCKESTLGIPGIEAAARIRPEIILLDAHLPDGNAEQILSLIKANEVLRDTPVVIVTGDSFKEHLDPYKKSGAAYVISKPIDYQVLYDVIKEHALNIYNTVQQ